MPQVRRPVLELGVNGTLGGTGTIAPNGNNGITVSGNIAPGIGSIPGTLTFNLSSSTGLVMNSGASFQFHLGIPQSGDLISILGASSGSVVFNNNTINFMGTGSLGSYKLFDTDSNNANTWSGLVVDANGQITSGLNYSNLANGYSANFYVGGDSGDIFVEVIPEPHTLMLCGLAMVTLLRRRR